MSGISVASWVALAATGVLTGAVGVRWHSGESRLPATFETLLLIAAAAAVVAWFAQVGSILANAPGNVLLNAYVPFGANALTRLATLWAARPGGALTLATLLLATASLARVDTPSRIRFVTLLSVASLGALVVATWVTPPPNAMAVSILPFAQSVPAALAPLGALATLVYIIVIAALGLCGGTVPRALLLSAWLFSTLTIALEQMARSGLGVGPREAIVLGSASSALLLWLGTGVLQHNRVLRLVHLSVSSAGASRLAIHAAHAGVLMIGLSFGLHAAASRMTLSLEPGRSSDVRDAFGATWTLANQGISRFDAEDIEVTSLALDVRDPGGTSHLVAPAIQEHHARDGRHLENPVSRRQSVTARFHAMRALLVATDSTDRATVRITFLPLPILWPAGVALVITSILLSLTGSRQPTAEPQL